MLEEQQQLNETLQIQINQTSSRFVEYSRQSTIEDLNFQQGPLKKSKFRRFLEKKTDSEGKTIINSLFFISLALVSK